MIDRMVQRTPGKGKCELCEKEVATRKAKFKAEYVEAMPSPGLEEEALSSVDIERRVCDRCLASLKNSKNVTNLVFERL